MTLFRLDASIFPDRSASRELADIVESEWTATHPDELVIRRHIGTSPLPPAAWADSVVGHQLPEDGAHPCATGRRRTRYDAGRRTARRGHPPLRRAALQQGVSQHVKTWFDILYTDPRINEGGPELRDRPAVLVTVTGGNYGPGTPKEGWDHSSSWLERILVDVLGLDLATIHRKFTLVGVNPALDAFTDMADEMRVEAIRAAEIEGRKLAARGARKAA
jgi:FMN-dependent NADH-azoreductase